MIDTEKLYLKFWILAAKDFGYDMKPEHVYSMRSMARKYSIPTLKGFLGEDCPTEEIRAHRTELMSGVHKGARYWRSKRDFSPCWTISAERG